MTINSENFLNLLKAHEEQALEFVLREYGGFLMSVIRKHLFLFPSMQEECMNDVLLRIWEHIDQFDETRNTFKNWMAGIARYQSIDYLRKYKKHLEEISLSDICEGREDTALLKLIESELSAEIEEMLSCLKPKDRSIFLKLFYEDMDVEDVSREMGIKKSAIYQKVSRGRKKLLAWRQKGGSLI
ncbi:sigma-70 family RNA polymerase sigma factor [Lachnospiraceae bacterium MD308]|nr:sigma-70 family RNA polymerase sigma factor [Lachnospiraceae bacterium MD308]MCI8579646.1 sigma-70 family RNA polymerase sigma factor [Dorea sp.]